MNTESPSQSFVRCPTEAFRIVYAIHFVLGTYVALRLWPYTLAIFGLVSDFDITFLDFCAASTISVLATLWYFVWYAFLRFIFDDWIVGNVGELRVTA